MKIKFGNSIQLELNIYQEIRFDIETWSTDRVQKTSAISFFNFGKQHKTTNSFKKLQIYKLYIKASNIFKLYNSILSVYIYTYILYIQGLFQR